MGRKGKKGKRGGEQRVQEGSPPATTIAGPPLPPVDPAALAARLSSAAIHLLRRLGRAETAAGLSGARLSALSMLVLGGPRTLGALARAEGVTPPSMTRMIAAMERDGLVERTRSARDGRLVFVAATPEGQRHLQEGRDQRVATLAALLGGIASSDQHTLDEASAILEELLRTPRPA